MPPHTNPLLPNPMAPPHASVAGSRSSHRGRPDRTAPANRSSRCGGTATVGRLCRTKSSNPPGITSHVSTAGHAPGRSNAFPGVASAAQQERFKGRARYIKNLGPSRAVHFPEIIQRQCRTLPVRQRCHSPQQNLVPLSRHGIFHQEDLTEPGQRGPQRPPAGTAGDDTAVKVYTQVQDHAIEPSGKPCAFLHALPRCRDPYLEERLLHDLVGGISAPDGSLGQCQHGAAIPFHQKPECNPAPGSDVF